MDLIWIILTAVAVLGVIGFVLGGLLALASGVFAVKEDARKELILDALPAANCGGCGYAGCGAYVDAILKGEASPSLCCAGGQKAADAIAKIMGIDSEHRIPKHAVIACRGNANVAVSKYEYSGIADCRAASRLLGGHMLCQYGCVGMGNCAAVCPYDAIIIEDMVARVVREKCVGCGNCVAACPKHLIRLLPETSTVAVNCSSLTAGKLTKAACKVGCIGCKICEKNCPVGAVTVRDNLAHIDYEKCTDCGRCVQKCPVNAIEEIRVNG